MVTGSLPAAAFGLVVGGLFCLETLWSGTEEFGSQRFGGSTRVCVISQILIFEPLYRLWEVKGRDYVGICTKNLV